MRTAKANITVKVYNEDMTVSDRTVDLEIKFYEMERRENEYGRGHYIAVEFYKKGEDDCNQSCYDYRYMVGYTFEKAVYDILTINYGNRIVVETTEFDSEDK